MTLSLKILRFILASGFAALTAGLVIAVAAYIYITPQLPPIDRLKEVQLQVPLRVYSADGELIAEFGEQRREPVRYAELPQAVIDTITDDDLATRATHLGDIIRASFEAALTAPEVVVEVRGRGLMLGIELVRSCGELSALALDAGLLINVTAGNTVRLLPPLILEDEQARTLGHGVASLINRWA